MLYKPTLYQIQGRILIMAKKNKNSGCSTVIAVLLLIVLIISLRQIIGIAMVLGAIGATIYGFVKRDKFKQLDTGKRVGAIALILGCFIFGVYLAQSGQTNTNNTSTPPTEVAQEAQQSQETQQPQGTQQEEQSNLYEVDEPEKTEGTLVPLPTTTDKSETGPAPGSTEESTKESTTKSTNEESIGQSNKEVKSAIELVKATVTRVVDGDTVYVKLDNGTEEKVRMIGVDTPESTIQHEPYGKEASNFTKEQLEGKEVYLEKDVSETDKYGRLLRYIWLEPPEKISEEKIRVKMFNAILLLNGYAQVATYPPDVKYVDYFTKFQKEAREANIGLWAIEPSSNLATNTETGEKTLPEDNPTSSQKEGEQTGEKKEITVYVTATGEKYHKDGCRYLKKSKIPMSLSEAKESGYEPCSVCKPPR